jgi:hypothetical protein
MGTAADEGHDEAIMRLLGDIVPRHCKKVDARRSLLDKALRRKTRHEKIGFAPQHIQDLMHAAYRSRQRLLPALTDPNIAGWGMDVLDGDIRKLALLESMMLQRISDLIDTISRPDELSLWAMLGLSGVLELPAFCGNMLCFRGRDEEGETLRHLMENVRMRMDLLAKNLADEHLVPVVRKVIEGRMVTDARRGNAVGKHAEL